MRASSVAREMRVLWSMMHALPTTSDNPNIDFVHNLPLTNTVLVTKDLRSDLIPGPAVKRCG
jgi:hypothetical protein